MVVGLCLVTLAVLVVVFTVAGVHKNSQINELHHDGVPVTVTVTSCLGLMGGSGSNAAGYSCSGSFTVHGTHYTESLPGSGVSQPIGSTLAAIAVPNDPALDLPEQHRLDSEHASFSVFVLPLILLARPRAAGRADPVRTTASPGRCRRPRRPSRPLSQHSSPSSAHLPAGSTAGAWPSFPSEGCSACWDVADPAGRRQAAPRDVVARSFLDPPPANFSFVCSR